MASNLNKRPAKEKALTPLQRACLHSVEFYPDMVRIEHVRISNHMFVRVVGFDATSGTVRDFSDQYRSLKNRKLVRGAPPSGSPPHKAYLTPAGRATLYGWGELPQEVIQ